jgi:hypothetical protein
MREVLVNTHRPVVIAVVAYGEPVQLGEAFRDGYTDNSAETVTYHDITGLENGRQDWYGRSAIISAGVQWSLLI